MKEDPSRLSPENLAKAERIAYLIAGYINKSLTSDEQDELDNWVAESDHNILLFEELIDEKNLAAMVARLSTLDKEGAAEMAIEKIRAVRRVRSIRILAIAASFLVIVAGAYFFQTKTVNPKSQVHEALVSDVPPGGNHAILKLSSGNIIQLDTIAVGKLNAAQLGSVVKIDSGLLSYSGEPQIKLDDASIWNQLIVPRGGQYQVILPDNTHVWLNTSSSLKYPVSFSGKSRAVELTGEAYFQVAKDPVRPFIVTVNNGSVEVLGTHFNVNGYLDNNQTNTTLLAGSVKVHTGLSQTMLNPGQQVGWDISGKLYPKIEVDTEAVTAWQRGLFSFEKGDIEEIMLQVARWYDVEIVYHGKIHEHFTANIERNVPVSQLLRLLENTGGVHFQVDGKKIIVNP
ncbi:MAG TPA: FecR domain-containing protein [Puia sp.]|nr:FecR domain-containing protein [Puia sp.]